MARRWLYAHRHRAAALLLGAAAPLLAAASVPGPPPSALERIYELHYRGRSKRHVGLGLRIVDRSTLAVTREELVNGDLHVYPSSAVKTVIAVAFLRRLDLIRATPREGLSSALQLHLKKPTLLEQLRIQVPIWQRNATREWYWKLPRGRRVTLSYLFEEMMVTISNNVAANQLIDIAVDRGAGSLQGSNERTFIADTVVRMGIDPFTLRVAHKLFTQGAPEGAYLERGRGNTSTARSLLLLYDEIATGRRGILAEESRAFLVESLRLQTTRSKLNRYILSPEFHHKSGDSPGATGDAGFFLCGDKVIIVAVMQGYQDRARLRRVGRTLMELLERDVLPGACLWIRRHRLPKFKLSEFERDRALRVLETRPTPEPFVR